MRQNMSGCCAFNRKQRMVGQRNFMSLMCVLSVALTFKLLSRLKVDKRHDDKRCLLFWEFWFMRFPKLNCEWQFGGSLQTVNQLSNYLISHSSREIEIYFSIVSNFSFQLCSSVAIGCCMYTGYGLIFSHTQHGHAQPSSRCRAMQTSGKVRITMRMIMMCVSCVRE